MSSPSSVKPNSLEINKPSSPLKELDNSYDSRESLGDQDPQRADPTVKKVKKVSKKPTAQQDPEEPLREAEELAKVETAGLEVREQVDKKKKKKKAKKTEENGEDQASDVTATFPKQSTERKELTENYETNRLESFAPQKETESAATKSKKQKKKAVEPTEDVNGTSSDVKQEEKPKKAKTKAVEKKEEARVAEQVVEEKSPVNASQQKGKVVKKAQVENPKEFVVGAAADSKQKTTKQETGNMRPQSNQANRGNRNLEVSEPAVTKSTLVNALVSPAHVSVKANAQSKRNTNTAENENRYTKNTWNTQARDEEEVAARSQSREKKPFVPMGKALEAHNQKKVTQEESSTGSPKSKLGPIKSKIQTGLNTLRVATKTADASVAVSVAATTRATRKVTSPDTLGQQKGKGEVVGHRSYADIASPQKSYVLEKASHSELKKKRSEKPRMRSFDAGKTDKIKAEDSFETRNKMWQIRKAEKLMEEEKKRTRKETEACTFNPKLIGTRPAPVDLSTSSVYDRAVEWSQKVKTAVQAKGEQILEETKKPEPKKPRIKSITGPSEIKSSKVTIEGFTGPQFGIPKTINVPSYSQDPLKFGTNLEQKISEIHDVYESVSNALKKKSANASRLAIKEVPKQNFGEVRSASRVSVSSQKERVSKMEPIVPNKAEDQRMSTLKQMLNLNQKEKKDSVTVIQTEPTKAPVEQNPDYFAGKAEEVERIVPRNGQRVEIRNNRYVIVDDNDEC